MTDLSDPQAGELTPREKADLALPRTPVREYISHHIDKMRNVRRDNNDLWMAILDIALKHAPGPTKELVRRIRDNDRKVAELFDEIAGC